jgi:hypothetical protein
MAAQANTLQNPRHRGRTLNARLMDVGLYALANDYIQMVHAVTPCACGCAAGVSRDSKPGGCGGSEPPTSKPSSNNRPRRPSRVMTPRLTTRHRVTISRPADL